MAATARPSRPVAPDVFTLASSNTHSPADLAGLESRASEVSTPALGGSPDVAPGPGQRGRVEEEPNHANEKAPLDSQGTRPSEPAMSAYARSSLPSFDRAQEQPGVPAWAPFFASNASYRDAESLDSDKSGDRGAHQRQGLSASVPPFDPVIGHFVRTVPPRSRPEVAQDRPWSSSLPRGRGFSGESLPPRSDRHESPFRPVDPPPRPANPISRQESHAASWTWLPRSDDTPRSSPATASRLEQPAPNASGSTQGSPARFGGALIDLADDTDGSSPSAKNKNKGPFATRYVFLQDLRPEMSEEEFGSRIKTVCRDLSLRGCFTGHLASFGHAVLVFSDLRHAISALRRLELDSPLLALAGSAGQNPLLSASEGVLVFTLRGPTSTPNFTPLPILATFGEIRAVKLVERGMHVVEYWDEQAAETAMKVLSGRESGGAKFGCSFEPKIASTTPLAWQSTQLPGPRPRAAGHEWSPARERESTPQEQGPHQTPPRWQTTAFDAYVTVTPSPSPHKHSLLRSEVPLDEYRFPPQPRGPNSTPAGSPIRALGGGGTRSPGNAQPGRPGTRLPSEYGLVRDDKIPVGNMVNFDRIERGLDVRTTLMIKNIPNKMKDTEVMEYIEEVVGRSYDFFYLRCDYSNDCNVGYGFVNFVSTLALLNFTRARLGTRWNKCGSDKLCVLSYANIQASGKPSLINHFKNSSVLDQDESRRPKLFITSGPHAGEPEPFPACDDPLRKARSAMNASNVGLFPSSKPVFKIAHALQNTHI
ncbi:hypothetical protein C6P46_002273 [Rhodotorula mucilaginosa]|uniref:Mei2-like C-terminal RNA recognition motif domain-containing protein n=1 Tax=Rhodotorula mucilaginosa TaxID=5537 RepID=A0A9P6W640_RHOMI|nr:hypothetical protein C6P46_002273 [Rhodotorula mucilaginosa]